MQDLQSIRAWLMSAPFWEPNAQLFINFTDAIAGNCGLFPLGTEEVSKKEDVLGNMQVVYRTRFAVYRVTERAADGLEDAAWVENLQQWVCKQSRLGLAPRFGDVPNAESIRAEKGRLTKTRQPEKALYAVELTAEFTKIYEVI